MNQENELKRLEGFVAKLLKSFQDLKKENARLMADLQARDEVIASLEEQLTETDTAKNEISNRVSSIIEQIEEWEVNLGEEVFDEEVPINDSSRQGNLFSSVGSDRNKDEERDKSVATGYGE